MDGIEIVEAGAERLDEVEPIWILLSEHHADLTPARLPVRPPAEGWPVRRRRYEEALEDGAVLFLAVRGDEAVGFALAFPQAPRANLAIDRLLEIETIAVLPEARGAGVGSALMDAVEAWADAHGIEHLQVAVREANDGARRLYERRGFKPFYTTMIATRPQS
jgi:ribosomal protein S18 acetylase RimI-like enzyme